jgi:hypothetical protein
MNHIVAVAHDLKLNICSNENIGYVELILEVCDVKLICVQVKLVYMIQNGFI